MCQALRHLADFLPLFLSTLDRGRVTVLTFTKYVCTIATAYLKALYWLHARRWIEQQSFAILC